MDEVKPFKCGEVEFKILKIKFKVIFHHFFSNPKKKADRILQRIFGTKNGSNLPYLEGEKMKLSYLDNKFQHVRPKTYEQES